MVASAPPLLVSTKRSTDWPSGVFPNCFFEMELCCGVAPVGARVVISNAPVKIVTAIHRFIRVPRPHIFSLAARASASNFTRCCALSLVELFAGHVLVKECHPAGDH